MMRLTKKEWEKVETSKKPAIIDFSAEWCMPCRALAPIFDELSTEIKEANFFKVDIDTEEELSNEFQIMSVPTILIIKNNVEIGRINGFSNKEHLKSALLSKIK